MGKVLALEEMLALPVDQAKAVMLDLSKTISDQKLAEAWSTHFTLVRKLRSILGIHKNHSGTIVNVTEIQGDKWPPAFRLPSRKARGRAGGRTEKVVVMQNAVDERVAAPEPGVRGLTLSIKGNFSGAELGARIEAIRTLLFNCAGSRYTVDLSLDEVILAGVAADGARTAPAPQPEGAWARVPLPGAGRSTESAGCSPEAHQPGVPGAARERTAAGASAVGDVSAAGAESFYEDQQAAR